MGVRSMLQEKNKHKEKKIMLINDIKTWKDYRGKKELLKHMAGEALTMKQAIIAQCYSCTAGYFDGRVDCQTKDCPIYQFMPYRKEKIKRVRSEKQIEASKKSHFGREKATRKHHSSNSDV
jgi:hypothetical protein